MVLREMLMHFEILIQQSRQHYPPVIVCGLFKTLEVLTPVYIQQCV